MPEPFIHCLTCHDPLNCANWNACASTTVLPHGERVGPPMPTKRGLVMVGPEDGPAKVVDVDYSAIEKRIMTRMASINGAAEHVVERFCELSKTDSGTPLFRHKFRDGSLTPTSRMLLNLVINAIQGEVTL